MTTESDGIRMRTLELVQSYGVLLAQQRWNDWIELWAEDGELDFPFAPAGRQRTYVGKAEILAYMTATPGKMAIDAIDQRRVFPMQDPEIAVVELVIKGRALATGQPYNQSYVILFETKGGKIRRYREYWNPLVSIDAFGGREAWTASFGKPARAGAAS